MKTCTVCKIEKECGEFYTRKGASDGLQPNCKPCHKFTVVKWKTANSEKVKEQKAAYKAANPDKVKEWHQRYKEAITPERKEKEAERRRNNRQRWKGNSTKDVYAYQKKRRQYDPLFRLSRNVRSALRKSFKSKGWTKTSSTAAMLGCSFPELEAHLIATAVKNYGMWLDTDRFHIDHVIPLATAKTPEDIKALNHYSNLQWLTPKDNLAKGARV
jgi:Arc/MetJ family transcription regulator